MKKQFKLYVIILALVFNIFSFAKITLPPTAKATYVEGVISQDTIWTIIDSPFIVSKNVTVLANATLTIEAGVEVRFGDNFDKTGNFNMTIEGRLTAVGEENKKIKFTSNKITPLVGDWNSIIFNSASASIMKHCIIEYGKNGTSIINGTVDIKDSLIRANSQVGISITNGIVSIENNEITNNALTGILIAGGSNVTVNNNNIKSNGDGILLTGNLISPVTITKNNVSLNINGGIVLNATAYDNTAIIDNRLSDNYYGFYVASDTSTYITHNYVSNNDIGIFYEKGANHKAHFNDIFNNRIGMDVNQTGIEVVNAEYNYWGDRSGPYHESLNPYGKGNTVLGNGVNLDFIFFLTASFTHNNTAPTADFWTDKLLVAPNQNVTFIGTNSIDEGRVDQYFYDFGDTTNTGWTTLSLFTHSFSSTGIYSASLQVKDDFNVTSAKTYTTVRVQNLPSLEATVTLSNYTINYNDEVSVTVFVSDGVNAVENATVTLFSIKGGTFAPQTGLTDATGHFSATFTAPYATEIINTRIMARANKTGYADGSDFKYLEILPPLKVQIAVDPATVKSEATATATVLVTGVYDKPVAGALVVLSADGGDIMSPIQYTDLNGTATYVFTAPRVLSYVDVTLTALVKKFGYAETQAQKFVGIEPRTLVVELVAEPSIVESEATAKITAQVTYNDSPIANARVAISSNAGGQFSETIILTDSSGSAVFYYFAPQVTVRVNATIIVIASEIGYLDGEAQTVVTLMPKVLVVYATAKPTVTISEGKMNITVHVRYGTAPIREANVTIASGDFSTTGFTDENGNVTLVFTAPQVNQITEIAITSKATKTGYVDGFSSITVLVQPGVLNVTVTTDKSSVVSTLSAIAIVRVTCNGAAVPNATVTVTASEGIFQNSTGITDENGTCTFVYYAPSVAMQTSALLRANATKNGYVSASDYTTILVNPEEAGEGMWGLSLWTILLIAIPIAIVVIVVVLIKLKVISVSFGEEENE